MSQTAPLRTQKLDLKNAPSAALTGLFLFMLALVVRLVFLKLANNNGTDAWARYLIAKKWSGHPTELPSDVWLPVPFWLLGTALRVWNSELSARFLTALLGAATIVPYWATLRRIFGSQVALWSSIFFALFSFHVAYSVTTSSEAPTIFFLMLGLYGWVRFYLDDGWRWLLLVGVAFSAASLCRVEPWLYIPILSIWLLMVSERGVRLPNSKSWLRATAFSLAAAPGVAGWLIYSTVKWGQPFAVAKRTAALSAHFSIQQPLLNRLIAVPGALLITLSPLVVLLVVLGIFQVRHTVKPLWLFPIFLALMLAASNLSLAVRENLTMARYTLMYSWLLIPYAFEGLRAISSLRPDLNIQKASAGVLLFFLAWQAGIVAEASYGPPRIADKLSSVSPTLPLSVEVRHLAKWLSAHRSPGDAVVLDHFNYEAIDVIRYAQIPASDYFLVPEAMNAPAVSADLRTFLIARHPRYLVYAPGGLLRNIWRLDSPGQIIDDSALRLSRQWEEGSWQVYEISYANGPVAR